MNPILRNILAVIAGILVGGFVNMTIVSVSGSIIPPPEGVNPEDMESIKANMHLYQAKHFIMPFLAHALGSLVAGILAALIAANRKILLASIAGGFWIIGGIGMTFMIPQTPVWFIALDLIVAYIPMGWLGGTIVSKLKK